jgi:uracil-DNA glycosylase
MESFEKQEKDNNQEEKVQEILPEILPMIHNQMTFLELSKCVPSTWRSVFLEAQDEFKHLDRIIKIEVFPEKKNIFKCFELTPLDQVRVVLLGQEPYHQRKSNGRPRAQGLSFSVSKDDEIPIPLKNIFQEIANEYPDYQFPKHGDLSLWARQGVLLVNSSLTVEPGKAGSHGVIWHGLLSKVFQAIGEVNRKCIYLLWGNFAKDMVDYIPETSVKLFASHPISNRKGADSFFGCNHFKEVNRLLEERGEEPIQW